MDIGLLGEQNARTAEIDVSEFLEKWPDTTPVLYVIRPGESAVYAATTTLDGTTLKWTATAYDTAIRGKGKAQIYFGQEADDETILLGKSEVFNVIIGESLEGTEDADMPDPFDTWAATIAAYVTSATQQALAAEGYALGTQNGVDVESGSTYYQNNAKYYSEAAEQAAANAGFMAVKIENGHLIYTRSDVVDVNLSLEDGHLILEVE